MLVNLEKKDVINLIRGIYPVKYEQVEKLKDLNLGYVIGSFAGRIVWNEVSANAWDKFTTEELYDIYNDLQRL